MPHRVTTLLLRGLVGLAVLPWTSADPLQKAHVGLTFPLDPV